MQMVGDGDHGEQGGHETSYARREHEAVGKEGGHPHAQTELARKEFSHGPSQAFTPWLLVDLLGTLLLPEFGKRGAQGTRYRILGTDQAQLVGRHPQQRDVPGVYPFRYGPACKPCCQKEDGEDEVESSGQHTIGGKRHVFALLVLLEGSLGRASIAHYRSSRHYAHLVRAFSGYPLSVTMPKHAPRAYGAVRILQFTFPARGSRMLSDACNHQIGDVGKLTVPAYPLPITYPSRATERPSRAYPQPGRTGSPSRFLDKLLPADKNKIYGMMHLRVFAHPDDTLIAEWGCNISPLPPGNYRTRDR